MKARKREGKERREEKEKRGEKKKKKRESKERDCERGRREGPDNGRARRQEMHEHTHRYFHPIVNNSLTHKQE